MRALLAKRPKGLARPCRHWRGQPNAGGQGYSLRGMQRWWTAQAGASAAVASQGSPEVARGVCSAAQPESVHEPGSWKAPESADVWESEHALTCAHEQESAHSLDSVHPLEFVHEPPMGVALFERPSAARAKLAAFPLRVLPPIALPNG